jgi:hypothetical protein
MQTARLDAVICHRGDENLQRVATDLDRILQPRVPLALTFVRAWRVPVSTVPLFKCEADHNQMEHSAIPLADLVNNHANRQGFVRYH